MCKHVQEVVAIAVFNGCTAARRVARDDGRSCVFTRSTEHIVENARSKTHAQLTLSDVSFSLQASHAAHRPGKYSSVDEVRISSTFKMTQQIHLVTSSMAIFCAFCSTSSLTWVTIKIGRFAN